MQCEVTAFRLSSDMSMSMYHEDKCYEHNRHTLSLQQTPTSTGKVYMSSNHSIHGIRWQRVKGDENRAMERAILRNNEEHGQNDNKQTHRQRGERNLGS